MTTSADIPIRITVDQASIRSAVSSANAQLAQIGHGVSANAANPAIQSLINSLQGAGAVAGQTAANMNAASSAFGSVGASAQAALSRVVGMNGALGGIATAGAAVGATAIVGGLVALGTAAVNASAKMESYRASLTTILGDTDKAAMAMDRLAEFAAKTPFSLDQSVQGFIKLRALGLVPSEEAMLSYGNTASALGKDLNQMVEAVADASTGEFERLKEFGIKASQQGDKVTMTFQGMSKTIGNNSTEIQNYLMAIGNTQFAGAMDKQAKTFSGAMSALGDSWDQTLAAMGDAGLMAGVAEVINMISSGIDTVRPLIVALGSVMGNVLSAVTSVASGIGSLFSGLTTNGGQGLTFVQTLTLAFNAIGQTVEVVGNIIGAVFGAAGQVIGGVVGTVKGLFGDFFDSATSGAQKSSGDIGLSFIGILRAGKYLTENLSKLFSAALDGIGGMFGVIGKRLKDFVSGNFSAFDGIGGAIAAQFQQAGKEADTLLSKAQKIAGDKEGADAAWKRMTGQDQKKEGGPSLTDLAGGAPKPQAAAPSGDKGSSGAASDRLKAENEFWKSLQQQTVAAGMLTNEAELYNKGLELRKALGRDLTAIETDRVAAAVGELRTATAITSLRQRAFEVANDNTVQAARALGLTESQKAVEDQLFAARLTALNKGVDINSETYRLAENDLKVQLEKNEALKEQNDLLSKSGQFARRFSGALDASKQLGDMEKEREAFDRVWNANGGLIDGQVVSKSLYDSIMDGYRLARTEIATKPIMDALGAASSGSVTAQTALDRIKTNQTYEAQQNGLKVALDAQAISPEEFKRASKEIAQDYRTQMRTANALVANDFTDKLTNGLNAFADQFGGVFGDVLKSISNLASSLQDTANPSGPMSKLAGLFGSKVKDGFDSAASKMTLTPENLKAGFAKLGNPLGDLKESFGPNGSLAKGLGAAVGGAMQGLKIGEQVGDMMSALGIGSKTGAKIGGAIGGITGNPIIAAAASVVGGVIGKVFAKKKYGTATITGAEEDDVSIRGNKGSYKKAAGTAAESVQSGLTQIADALGGEVGDFMVSIGQYKGKWRVSDTGRDGKLKGKYSDVTDFGKEGAEQAIAYAISDAISDGAIKGITEFAQKALKALEPDSAIALAQAFKEITDELDSMADPIGAVVRGINEPLDALIKKMREVGASSTDLATVEEYRAKKLDEAFKSQLSSINDFIKSLNGEGSGVSALDRLNASVAEFKTYQDRIAAGDSAIDQSAFVALGQEIFGLARDLYGTSTSEFQNLRNMLVSTSASLGGNVTAAFDAAKASSAADATAKAIEAQTSATVSQQVITNDLLKQLIEKQSGSNFVQAGVQAIRTANGKIVDTVIW